MDVKARAIAALREAPPLDWHRWHDYYRRKRDRLRRERAERDKLTKIRLTKTGWAVLAVGVLEVFYVAYLVHHEHQNKAALRPAAVQKGNLVSPGANR